MQTITTYITQFITFINTTLVPLVFALAFLLFLWGVFRYFFAGATNPEKRSEGTKFILWAIIAFAIMLSVWGLVNLVKGSFTLNSTQPTVPSFTGSVSTGSTTTQSTLPTQQLGNQPSFGPSNPGVAY